MKRDEIVVLFANGLGPLDPPIADGLNSCDPDGMCLPGLSNLILRHTRTAPTVVIGGVTVPDTDLLFSGLAPFFVGLYQINFRIPRDAPVGDNAPVVLRMGAVESRPDVTLKIQ